MTSTWDANTLGIDFGTSNSAAGVCAGGRPFLIPSEPGETTLPTSVFFGVGRSEMTIGNMANRALINGDEGRYMRALKSVLGTSLMGEKRTFLGEKMDFYDIIGQFLSVVKTRAEAACHQPFDYALSGRPVRFHSRDADRNAKAQSDLVECYLRAGFKDVRFMFEPEAAALATQFIGDEGLSLIVDIGGGTSDFSVFRSGTDGVEVLASHGVRVGGTDFDKRLSVDHVMPLLGRGALIRKEMGSGTMTLPNSMFQQLATWEQIPFMYGHDVKRDVARMQRLAVDPPVLARLSYLLEMELGHDVAFAVEAGKIKANSGDGAEARIDLSILEKGVFAPLGRDQLAVSLAEHVQEVVAAALATFEQADCTAEQINRIIFVGGSSLLRPIQSAMQTACVNAELAYADAFTAVIDGLALASAAPLKYGTAP